MFNNIMKYATQKTWKRCVFTFITDISINKNF